MFNANQLVFRAGGLSGGQRLRGRAHVHLSASQSARARGEADFAADGGRVFRLRDGDAAGAHSAGGDGQKADPARVLRVLRHIHLSVFGLRHHRGAGAAFQAVSPNGKAHRAEGKPQADLRRRGVVRHHPDLPDGDSPRIRADGETLCCADRQGRRRARQPARGADCGSASGLQRRRGAHRQHGGKGQRAGRGYHPRRGRHF